MNIDMLSGLGLILLAGALGGSLFMPMKRVAGWSWENTWITYSFFGYFSFPWVLAFASVPNLMTVYQGVSPTALMTTLLLGLGWGLSVVLYGLAVDRVGISLTSGIILGSSVSLGSLIPLFMSSASSKPSAAAQVWIIAAVAVMLLGVLLCTWAGALREKSRVTTAVDPGARVSSTWSVGLILCLLSGALAPLLNIAIAQGEPIAAEATQHGADDLMAPNAVLAIAVSAGSLPSIFYCLYKLARRRTWPVFAAGRPGINLGLCVLMGLFFISSTMFYASGAARMGSLGPVIGWPIYLSSIILVSNAWGWLLGEWRRIHGAPVAVMATGIAVQLAAMVLLGIAAA